jgi:hypothetical protein
MNSVPFSTITNKEEMMKKLSVLVICYLLFPLLLLAGTPECPTCNSSGQSQMNTTVEQGQQQNQQQGNQQVIQFNYPEANNTTRVISPPSAFPGGEFFNTPGIPFKDEVAVIQTTPLYPVGSRYSREQLKQKLELRLDLVQVTWDIKAQPNTTEPIYTLPGLLNEAPLGKIQFQGPVNGFYEETLKLAVSLAALKGAHRVCILREMVNNPWNASNGIGSAGNYSELGGKDFGVGAAVAPRNGKGQARDYKIPMITLFCYGPGPVPPAQGLLSLTSATKSVLEVPLINGFPRDTDLERIAKLICANRRNIKSVTVIGISNDQAIGLIAFEAMKKIGKMLRECGYCPQQTIELLTSKVIVGNSNKIRFEIQ